MAATLIGFSGIVARAQTDEEVSAVIAEALLLPEWQNVFSMTTGTGYKDNIFLSHTEPQGRPFVILAGEWLLFRVQPDDTRVNIFANGEARHFFGVGVSHQEYSFFSQAQVEHDLGKSFTVSLAAQYLYEDQVLDISISETNREAVPVRGHTPNLRPALRWNLSGHNWLVLETPLTRQFFSAPLDDYYEAGVKLTWGHRYGWDSQILLSYEPLWRAYDHDPARTAGGEAIPNSHRLVFQQNLRLVWRHFWDEPKRWRTVTTLGGRLNDENGGGYSDYTKWLITQRVEYRTAPWEISVEGHFGQYDYLNQTLGATTPAKRRRTEWNAVLEIERRLTENVSVLASYDFDTNGSNDPLETYSVNTVSLSLRWEF